MFDNDYDLIYPYSWGTQRFAVRPGSSKPWFHPRGSESLISSERLEMRQPMGATFMQMKQFYRCVTSMDFGVDGVFLWS